MLQKIVFQDNIYHLCRSIDLIAEGLLLDLSPDYFLDKTIDDILFFDASIQKLTNHIRENIQMAGYTDTIHSLFSCQTRYLGLIERILSGKSAMKEEFTPLFNKLQNIRTTHQTIKAELEGIIKKSDKNSDYRDIVSSNELSELLNF